ncbi:hypothetical protein NDU88_007872 [Pleurodeles waltl]|uniref:Uncharacterized protein n=1 Tax=Pleurodeles waltl TaxID=8319 RepID=A0AAV7NXR8_PLEWA|nr:hypothetical protein NDU88_007872 [Pleurodeles waltl]
MITGYNYWLQPLHPNTAIFSYLGSHLRHYWDNTSCPTVLPNTPAAPRVVALHTQRGTPPLPPTALPHTMTMPRDKPPGKPAYQLLFSEVLAQQWPVPVMTVPPMTDPPETVQSPKSDISMERIQQEIILVGRRLKSMDTKISDLVAESRSIHNDIASFQDRVTNINHVLPQWKTNSTPRPTVTTNFSTSGTKSQT